MEPAQLAKTARASLANALNALQSADDAPDELLEVAEPIAQAMGLLHKIERSGGAVLDGRDVILKNVRGVLATVQALDVPHPALDSVLEGVAASLAKVNALARYKPGDGAAPAPAAPKPAEAAPAPKLAEIAPAPKLAEIAPAPKPAEPAPPPERIAPAPVAVIQAQPIIEPKPVVEQPKAAPEPAAVVAQPIIEPKPVIEPKPEPKPVVAEPKPAPKPQEAAPAPKPAQATATPAPKPAQATATPLPKSETKKDPPPQIPAGARTLDVELGTHSPSNFYKGLSGNDVIEHGGIFVATYRVPKIGAPVYLRVLLPGDYEFHATAIVQWTREAAGSVEPGFGARFTQIGPEGRQLVYRYARNREPMFYDDL
ncbi:hypothetical protein [Polyangium aurulentum]|uniref:hypothetical protein n=1 Tax=Polyangium aurulentum TaxID=2567896 RepID=UPI0010AE0364|nr:hypothetical protein [Polyangium aurulentum]UQA61545.1 hypothetical protein E8A73_014170 [Polyangium aurulentum]